MLKLGWGYLFKESQKYHPDHKRALQHIWYHITSLCLDNITLAVAKETNIKTAKWERFIALSAEKRIFLEKDTFMGKATKANLK